MDEFPKLFVTGAVSSLSDPPSKPEREDEEMFSRTSIKYVDVVVESVLLCWKLSLNIPSDS